MSSFAVIQVCALYLLTIFATDSVTRVYLTQISQLLAALSEPFPMDSSRARSWSASNDTSDRSPRQSHEIQQSGTDADASNSLIYAILTGDTTQASNLVASGVLISESDSWATYEASIQGPEMINALEATTESDTKVNRLIPGQMGDKTLHFLLRTPATRFLGGKSKSIQRLVELGADPLEKDRHGNTALHLLAATGQREDYELMEWLLLRPSLAIGQYALDLENHAGNTALAVAELCHNSLFAGCLLRHGADPRLRARAGSLRWALAASRHSFCLEKRDAGDLTQADA